MFRPLQQGTSSGCPDGELLAHALPARSGRDPTRGWQKLTKLNTGVFKCERIVPVTQYADYSAVGGGAITALDTPRPAMH